MLNLSNQTASAPDPRAARALTANGFAGAAPATSMPMQTVELPHVDSARYAKCIEVSKRVRFDIDRDVIRGRTFDRSKKCLPDGLSRVRSLTFLSPDEQTYLSQIQGRTYCNMFRLVERFISAKMLDVSRDYWLGDQTALEALVRFTDEELKHQEMFRRLEILAASGMPGGYRFLPRPDDVATVVLGKSTWAVLALVCHIEIFVLAHYKQSIEADADLSPLFKDVMLYHWREESQHAILDELEWKREDSTLSQAQRDAAVDDLIALVGAVDDIVRMQADADARFFVETCGRPLAAKDARTIGTTLFSAYRWQYIVSGATEPRFADFLGGLTDAGQKQRIGRALAPIVEGAAA